MSKKRKKSLEKNEQRPIDPLETKREEVNGQVALEYQKGGEFREGIDALQAEYSRRQTIALPFLEKTLGSKPGVEYFIAPPVMTRTDFDYYGDMDVVIIAPEGADTDFDSPEGLFIMPQSITREDLQEKMEKYPEVHDWFEKKLGEVPTSEKNVSAPEEITAAAPTAQNFNEDAVESKIRYGLSPETRANIREYRLLIADVFMADVQKRFPAMNWHVSGSTVENLKKFSICSDLDIDMLFDAPIKEEQNEIFWYLHNYLKPLYREKYKLKIDTHDDYITELERFAQLDPKFKPFYEEKYGIKLDDDGVNDGEDNQGE